MNEQEEHLHLLRAELWETIREFGYTTAGQTSEVVDAVMKIIEEFNHV